MNRERFFGKAPSLHRVDRLLKAANDVQVEIGGGYFPARPLGFYSLGSRLLLAWKVFKGEYDALKWPMGQ